MYVFTYLKSQKKEGVLAFTGSLSKYLQQPGLDQDVTRSWKLNLGLQKSSRNQISRAITTASQAGYWQEDRIKGQS